MPTREPISLTPWLLGEDSWHRATHAVFQPEGRRVQELRNFDLQDDGALVVRDGLTKHVSLVDAKMVFAGNGQLFVQDDDQLLLFRMTQEGWNSSLLASGLTGTVSCCEHANQVWWIDGTSSGVVSAAGTNSHWGLTVPPKPFLSRVSGGSLAAGRYQVVCTLKDANGAESGCVEASLIDLSASSSISVNLPGSLDPNATYVEVYATPVHETSKALMWQKEVAVGALPATLTSVRGNSTRPLLTQFRRNLPSGIDGIFSYMGWLMLWRGNELFRSSGLSHHLFHMIHSEALPDDVLGAAGLETGFWRVTARGAWWTTGTPPDFHTLRKDTLAYTTSQKVVPGELIPFLETDRLVALFMSSKGPMVGLPTGQMKRLVPDQLAVDVTSKKASIFII